MFGWLAARSASLCRGASHIVVSKRSGPITPHALIQMLPGLGSVLYLHTASDAAASSAWLPGIVLAQREFAPLLDTHWLIATSIVTDDGPREWCECVDRFGRTRTRWHLLPDTDYLAWDALTASCLAHSDVPGPIDVQPWRPDHASVVNFRLRETAGLLILEQNAPAALSPLGDRIAARIAQAESAVLQP